MASLRLTFFPLLSGWLAAAGQGGPKKHAGITSPLLPVPIPQFICPEGFIMEGGRCARHIIQPLAPICPEGILQQDETCMIVIPPGRTCPLDMILVGGTCVRTATAPASLECPPGYTFEPGYKKSTSVCVKPIQLPPSMVCPFGSAPDGDDCIAENIVLPSLTCAPDSTLTGNACIKTEIYECGGVPALSDRKHKGGSRWLEGDTGEMFHDSLLKKQDENLEYTAMVDQRMLGAKKAYNLTPGETTVEVAVVGQQCERRTLVPPILNCPPGSTLVGRECISASRVKKIPEIPIMSVETLPPASVCPMGFVPCGGSHKMKKSGGHDCCLQEETQFILGCPLGFTLLNGTCQAFRPAEFICTQPGFNRHKHKNECISTEYHVPLVA